MSSALIPLIDGFEEIEAVAVIDILRRAKIDVTTAAVKGGGGNGLRVIGSHGIAIEADAEWADVTAGIVQKQYDAIILPGGPGTKDLNQVKGLHHILRDFARAGKLTAAICAAPLILAEAGLLRGKKATCYPSVEEKLHGAMVTHDSVVEDGLVITSRGAGTAVAFALAIVRRMCGAEEAVQLGRSIIHRG